MLQEHTITGQKISILEEILDEKVVATLRLVKWYPKYFELLYHNN